MKYSLKRHLLQENQQHFDKIAELVCSEDFANINQGFELAAAIGAIGDVEYREEQPFPKHPHLIAHVWTITDGFDPDFMVALKNIMYSSTWSARPADTYLNITQDGFVWSYKTTPVIYQ
tara:strand:+ start:3385 stop:3741 length:357 start_codon:yes stop_codon:yes gene_type:complete